MRRITPLVILVVAVAAYVLRGYLLPESPGSHAYLGYVEAETLLLAAETPGRIASLPATKGASLIPGALAFTLDSAAADADVARATAAVATAEAQADDLSTGQRQTEIDQIIARRDEASANLAQAQRELERNQTLATRGATAASALDQAKSNVEALTARLAQLDASIATAKLPARDSQLAAARSRVDEARAAVSLARVTQGKYTVRTPHAARVDDTFFDVGEWVAAGQPVVSLVADEAVTLRFFVPEATLPKAVPGTTVTFRCDGCEGTRSATITRVAATPEFTPPVIYSQGARAKLVYLVEARPQSADAQLRPGLPIEVDALP
jgi:HlyD family secretion protein